MTTLAMTNAKANKTFIVQPTLMIITYDCQNIFIVQATVASLKDERTRVNVKILQWSLGSYSNPALHFCIEHQILKGSSLTLNEGL